MFETVYEFAASHLMWVRLAIIFLFAAVIVFTAAVYKSLHSLVEANPVGDLGFAYDESQDIFYSEMNAWQRRFGYCRLYDEAAPMLGMIIDCEPIYFDYDDKHWLIELWKGQYGAMTGFEVGVYTTDGPEIEIPGVFNGTLYLDTDDEDHLQMSFTLLKDDFPLFSRSEKHWWLTGFRLGEFSQTQDLKASVEITLKDIQMRDCFIEALKKTGYSEEEYYCCDTTVSLMYTAPHTPQPAARTENIEKNVQYNNKRLCEGIENILENIQDLEAGENKLQYLERKNRKLYKTVVKSVRSIALYKEFSKIVNAYGKSNNLPNHSDNKD